MVKEIIAIDGPAASGKSTVAKLVAQKLNYIYIDSGAMYRCLALFAIENKIDSNQITNYLNEIDITFKNDGSVYLNGADVSKKIRSSEVTLLVPKIAAIKEVRAFLVKMQQSYGQKKGVVMDGRDIGTVVFKDAKIKIFQTATVSARAKRRHLENIENNRESDLKIIMAEIEKRDSDDINRKESPLLKADDAIELDTSNLSIAENVEKIIEIFNKKVKK